MCEQPRGGGGGERDEGGGRGKDRKKREGEREDGERWVKIEINKIKSISIFKSKY